MMGNKLYKYDKGLNLKKVEIKIDIKDMHRMMGWPAAPGDKRDKVKKFLPTENKPMH